jgi:hypothetical protein
MGTRFDSRDIIALLAAAILGIAVATEVVGRLVR